MAGRDPESHRNEMIKVLSTSVGFSTFSCYINKKNKVNLWLSCGKDAKQKNMSLCNKVASGKENSQSASIQRDCFVSTVNIQTLYVVLIMSHSFADLNTDQLICSLESGGL